MKEVKIEIGQYVQNLRNGISGTGLAKRKVKKGYYSESERK